MGLIIVYIITNWESYAKSFEEKKGRGGPYSRVEVDQLLGWLDQTGIRDVVPYPDLGPYYDQPWEGSGFRNPWKSKQFLVIPILNFVVQHEFGGDRWSKELREKKNRERKRTGETIFRSHLCKFTPPILFLFRQREENNQFWMSSIEEFNSCRWSRIPRISSSFFHGGGSMMTNITTIASSDFFSWLPIFYFFSCLSLSPPLTQAW